MGLTKIPNSPHLLSKIKGIEKPMPRWQLSTTQNGGLFVGPVHFPHKASRSHTLFNATSFATKAVEKVRLIFSCSFRDVLSTDTLLLTMKNSYKLVHLWEWRGLGRPVAQSSASWVYPSQDELQLSMGEGSNGYQDPVRWPHQSIWSHTLSSATSFATKSGEKA